MKFEIDLKNYYKTKEALQNLARLHVCFDDDDMNYYFTAKGIALALEKLGIIESAEVYLYQQIKMARDEIEEEKQQKE